MNEPRARILIVEDDKFLREQIARYFAQSYRVTLAETREEALAKVRDEPADLVLLDMRLPPNTDSIKEGIRTAVEIRKLSPSSLTIGMSGDGDKHTVLKAAEAGVYDFFTKPIDITELEVIVRRALERRHLESEVQRLREELGRRYDFSNLKGNSEPMQAVKKIIRKVADSNATIMIRGESGTGKELVARAIHFNSPRRNEAFVALNCSAFPEHLVEDELFGHEKGAFTGAVSLREGRFERADRGTLFLDEVGTLTPAIQAKLLRVLETKEFERLGGKQTVRVDFRVVTATNQDLEADVNEGRFRADLYYRLNVVCITLPNLAQRADDIPLLTDHFLDMFCKDRGVRRKQFSDEAMQSLLDHEWRGNVRELEHLVESLVLLSEDDVITIKDLPQTLRQGSRSTSLGPAVLPDSGIKLDRKVAEFERTLLVSALEKAGGSKKEAAGLLGLNKDQMKYLCRKYNL